MELSTDMAELSWFWIELTDDAAATYELDADCAETELAADIVELSALDMEETADDAELLDDEADDNEDEMSELIEDEMEALAAEFMLEELVVVVVVTVVRV